MLDGCESIPVITQILCTEERNHDVVIDISAGK